MPEPKPNQKQRRCPPHNPGLRKLVEAKRKWPLASPTRLLPRGFLGWHERGYLPHFDGPNVTQFVTFMLHDSFPVKRRAEWEPILADSDELARRRKLELWLDRGHGECWLRQPAVASVVEKNIREQDGARYRLQAWAIMPNHVHLVVEVWDVPLSRLLNSWKGGSARAANLVLGRRGRFWEWEYFDTLIRDVAHLKRAVAYAEHNPVKARYVSHKKDWPWGSARLRDEFERLNTTPALLPPEGGVPAPGARHLRANRCSP